MAALVFAILAAALSGACFYLSNGVGEIWMLAWIACLPVLWIAYGNFRAGLVMLMAFAAYAMGQMNLVFTYWNQLPFTTLLIILIVPSLMFALAVLFARFAAQRLKPLLAALAFPALWTAWEFVVATNSADGTAGSLAYSQAGVPAMIQMASVFGLAGVTFFLTLNSSLLAMALRRTGRETRILAGSALLLFGAYTLFGVIRLQDTPGEKVRVAMIDSDALNAAAVSTEGNTPVETVKAYLSSASSVLRSGAKIVVLPEKIAVIEPAWRNEIFSLLQEAASRAKATIVVGFDMREDPRRNAALIFRPSAVRHQYNKRHLVPGLETAFQEGFSSGVFEPGRAVAICKDMDFAGTIRGDAAKGVRIMLVPAWDFGADGWAHARMAIVRGVEGGFAVVRTARLGFLTATDSRGRIVGGMPSTKTGFASVVADVPLGDGGTVYVLIGDLFAWLCVGLTIALAILAIMRRRREDPGSETSQDAAEESRTA